MSQQTLITVAAVLGPLVGVALGALLASRFQASHWFRDRRLDAFADVQTAIYNLIASAPHETEFPDPINKLAAMTRFDEAVREWQRARGRLGILAGRSVVTASSELHEAVKRGWEAKEADKAEWDRLWDGAKTLRDHLTDEMRTELRVR
jgi:hypothetical protein